jgi:hypothetical protein
MAWKQHRSVRSSLIYESQERARSSNYYDDSEPHTCPPASFASEPERGPEWIPEWVPGWVHRGDSTLDSPVHLCTCVAANRGERERERERARDRRERFSLSTARSLMVSTPREVGFPPFYPNDPYNPLSSRAKVVVWKRGRQYRCFTFVFRYRCRHVHYHHLMALHQHQRGP